MGVSTEHLAAVFVSGGNVKYIASWSGGKVKSEVEEAHREKQITIEEWIAMLEKGV